MGRKLPIRANLLYPSLVTAVMLSCSAREAACCHAANHKDMDTSPPGSDRHEAVSREDCANHVKDTLQLN